MNTQKLWIYKDETDSLVEKDVQIVPGLFKIFDEILVNAADNKVIFLSGYTDFLLHNLYFD